MGDDSLTIYKLMILYMLEYVDFPMTNSQLSEFFVGHSYTSYFQFRQAIEELTASGFLQKEVIRNMTNYRTSPEGREALSLFEKSIPTPFLEDIANYFEENRSALRREVEITADYHPFQNGRRHEYMVETCIKEKGQPLMELTLNVVSDEQARLICDKWSQKSDMVYAKIMEMLLLEE